MSPNKFVEKFSTRAPHINHDSIRVLSGAARKNFVLKQRCRPPQMEVEYINAADYEKFFIHGFVGQTACYDDEFNIIKIQQFDISASDDVPEKIKYFLQVLNKEAVLEYAHEYKHYEDRILKSLGGCSTAQILQFEIHLEIVARIRRMLLSRKIFKSIRNLHDAFPEAMFAAACEYEKIFGNFDWERFYRFNALERWSIVYRKYLIYLANEQNLADTISQHESDIIILSILDTLDDVMDTYMREQITATRLKLSLRDKYYDIGAHRENIVGFDNLLNQMYSFDDGNFLDITSASVQKKLFAFVRKYANSPDSRNKIKIADEAFLKYGGQKQTDIDESNSIYDISNPLIENIYRQKHR
ncbi:MAG: hypothetical protein LBJ73_02980 [Rickettsiales bacterium]|nr:hypothetical protein [Rickettsiales bacterium]